MFKKTLSALAVACVMLVSAAAAGTIFPAEYTDIDGVTRAGYLDEDGMTVLPFAYAQAGRFRGLRTRCRRKRSSGRRR